MSGFNHPWHALYQVALTPHQLALISVFQAALADALRGTFRLHVAGRENGPRLEVCWYPDPDRPEAVQINADVCVLSRAYAEAEGNHEAAEAWCWQVIESTAQEAADEAWAGAWRYELVSEPARPALDDGRFDDREED